jgi:hypothetical protein
MRCLSTLGLVASLTAVSAAAKTEDLGVVIGIDLGTTYRGQSLALARRCRYRIISS